MTYDPDTYMQVQLISTNCVNCARMDVDTYFKEKYKLTRNSDGSTISVPDGYENHLVCKHFEECKHIFEEGYHVEKDAISGVEQYTEEIQKIEKKPATRKTTKKTSTKTAKLKE